MVAYFGSPSRRTLPRSTERRGSRIDLLKIASRFKKIDSQTCFFKCSNWAITIFKWNAQRLFDNQQVKWNQYFTPTSWEHGSGIIHSAYGISQLFLGTGTSSILKTTKGWELVFQSVIFLPNSKLLFWSMTKNKKMLFHFWLQKEKVSWSPCVLLLHKRLRRQNDSMRFHSISASKRHNLLLQWSY